MPLSHPTQAEAPAEAPLFHVALRLEGEPCLVVGGGRVGARKAASLLGCGALVTVVAPETCDALEALRLEALLSAPPRPAPAAPFASSAAKATGERGDVTGSSGELLRIERREYRAGEASGFRLVVTATGRPEVDRAVYLDCRKAGVLINAADDPASCSFLAPAVLRSGPVSVAVSTGGASPWLARWVRDRVRSVVGPDVGLLTEIVGLARAKVRAAGHSSESLAWGRLVEDILWPLVSAGETAAARDAAERWAGSVIEAGVGSGVVGDASAGTTGSMGRAGAARAAGSTGGAGATGADQ